MATAQHTPAPWVVVHSKKNGAALRIDAPNDRGNPGAAGSVVRQNGIGIPAGPIGQANARLISAAPELLASVNELLAIYWGDGDGQQPEPECILRARAALSKATGA